jgi:hypothetical protein
MAEVDSGLLDVLKVERAAYHESGHIVAAARKGFALCAAGMHIYHNGCGRSFYTKPESVCRPEPGSVAEDRVFAMVITLICGLLAQREKFPECSNLSGMGDEEEINLYLGGIYPGVMEARAAARNDLEIRSKKLVQENWFAIESLAKALLAKDWAPRQEEADAWWPDCRDEKTLDGKTIVDVLVQLNVPASLDVVTIDCGSIPHPTHKVQVAD